MFHSRKIFLKIFRMVCTALDRKRRNMTISVTVLGFALATVFLAYFAFGDNENVPETSSIRFVSILHRHGARNMGRFYVNDPYINHTWRGGLGALTQNGSLQMYNLGSKLRQRYLRLIPSDSLYSPDHMFAMSSGAERCIMSGQSFFAGFLPPSAEVNNLPIVWQPVPITIIPRDRDDLIAQKRACEKYDRLLAQMYTQNTTEDLKDVAIKYANIFTYLTKHTGEDMTHLGTVEHLYITLSIEEEQGFALPAWTKTVYPEPLKSLAARHLALLTETEFMKRMKAGPVLTQILDNMMNKKLNQLDSDRSMYIYSAHDVTLVNVMRALNITDQTSRKPHYGATLAFELHFNERLNDLELRIIYYDSADQKVPVAVEIPNCKKPCTLDQYKESISHLIVRDFEADCVLD